LSNIRVTYTGLLSFVIAIITGIIGTLFTLILTRTLNTEEYGTWGLIISLTTYVTMLGGIISFWSTREISRGINSGRTAILGTTILSIIAIGVYIIVSYFMGIQTKSDLNALFFSSILIPVIFFNGILTAINLGWKPHIISYATLVFALTQLLFTFIFVYTFKFGLIGAISSTLISYVVSIVILSIYGRKKIKGLLSKTYIKNWLKRFWLPLYPSLSIIIEGLGVVVFSILTQSVIGLAFWTASSALSAIISNAGLISRGVYPKLLEGGSRHYLEDNLSQLFYFGFLMTGIVITFAKPGLFALNPIYESSFVIVIILGLRNFFLLLTNTSIQNLQGIENVDLDKKANFKNLIKSSLFYPHTLRLIQTLIFITILVGGLIFLINYNFTDHQMLLFWAMASLLTQIPLSLYLLKLMNKKLRMSFPIMIITKYFLITITSFVIIYVISQKFIIPNENPVEFIPTLSFFIVIGILLHFFISYILDSKLRLLTKSIIKELRRNNNI